MLMMALHVSIVLLVQVEAALHSADALLSKVSIIGEEPTLKEKVALMLQPAYILKGKTPPSLRPPPGCPQHHRRRPPPPLLCTVG